MSRSTRLIDLMQLLRRHRRSVTGEAIAGELGISLRTLYRDIATLQTQGARIDGAPGLGYVLRDSGTLPPLMFSEEELESLVLGMRWMMQRGDQRLAAAARDALAKVAAVLPARLQHELDSHALLVPPGGPAPAGDAELAVIRAAIRQQRKLRISYRDEQGKDSERVIWPFALGYFDRVQVAVAWCELRRDERHFRTDRMASARFHAQLLKRQPLEASPGFAMFNFNGGVMLGLWRAADVLPPSSAVGGCELGFAVGDAQGVHTTHQQWLAAGITIVQTPMQMDFGFTFTATDPDGHRLRVFAPSQP